MSTYPADTSYAIIEIHTDYVFYLPKVKLYMKQQIYQPDFPETLRWNSEKPLYIRIVASLTFTYHELVEGISQISVRSPSNIETEILYKISILNIRVRNPEPVENT